MTKTNLGSHPSGETINIQSKLYNSAEELHDVTTVFFSVGIIGDIDVVTDALMSRITLGVYEYIITPTTTGVYNGTIECTSVDGYVKIDEIEFTVYAV